MIDLPIIISIIGVLLAITGCAGCWFALKGNIGNTTSQAQERAITAMQAEIQSMQHKMAEQQKDNVRLNLILTTITAALKKRGLAITIDADMVSIQDDTGSSTHVRLGKDQVL